MIDRVDSNATVITFIPDLNGNHLKVEMIDRGSRDSFVVRVMLGEEVHTQIWYQYNTPLPVIMGDVQGIIEEVL